MLRVDDIHVYYGNIAAVKGLTLTVEEGEIVTLLGSNGAGKSTTLRTISGLLHPRRGNVTFQGRRVNAMEAHDVVRMGIAQAPEGPSPRLAAPLLSSPMASPDAQLRSNDQTPISASRCKVNGAAGIAAGWVVAAAPGTGEQRRAKRPRGPEPSGALMVAIRSSATG